uniref:Uncharacterized protein n=1 Tax=Anguilla anguilla TaxID=7936 RepID=A0A0E9PXS2_ANGAN
MRSGKKSLKAVRPARGGGGNDRAKLGSEREKPTKSYMGRVNTAAPYGWRKEVRSRLYPTVRVPHPPEARG